MKTIICFALAIGYISVNAQKKSEVEKLNNSIPSFAISIGINLPVGDFSNTHVFGIALEYVPAKPLHEILKGKKMAFTYNGGIAYYFSKKETVSSYPYSYPGYFFIHAFGGMLYGPAKKLAISFTAGPAMGIYNSKTQFNIGSKLEANYFINKNITIGPGLVFMKEPGTANLWAASIKSTILISSKKALQ